MRYIMQTTSVMLLYYTMIHLVSCILSLAHMNTVYTYRLDSFSSQYLFGLPSI